MWSVRELWTAPILCCQHNRQATMLKKQLKNVKDFIITIIPLQMNPYNIGFFYPKVKTNLLRWKIYPQISTRGWYRLLLSISHQNVSIPMRNYRRKMHFKITINHTPRDLELLILSIIDAKSIMSKGFWSFSLLRKHMFRNAGAEQVFVFILSMSGQRTV